MAPSLALPQDNLMALARESMHDLIVGCLFGSALGDAIGLYTEFLSGETSARAYPSRSFVLHPTASATPLRHDSHRDPHLPGDWTDDTDHAVLMLLSFLHSDGGDPDPNDFAARLHTWVQMGLRALDTLPLGLGHTVGSIVRSKDYLEDPQGAARRFWVKGGHKAAPNGSLMRTHPVGLFCVGKTLDETFQMALDFSVVTHADPRCVISCVIGSALIRGLVRREVRTEADVDALISKALEWYEPVGIEEPELDMGELRRHANPGGLAELELDDSLKMGYVFKTFGAGMHLLRRAMRELAGKSDALPARMALFETLMVDLVMQGGDADTNACFAGALLGAYLGWRALPPHWRDGLRHGSWLMGKAEGLSSLLGVGERQYSGSQDADTAPDGGRGYLTQKEVEKKFMLLQAEMASRNHERAKQGKGKRRR
ncbi:Uncharacterized protein ESCO_002022 [Escovopsis weberi]|uniref:ADP-ribosylglycohydrolase n=1 Tax=Escovopsis weberi TaxID=150374 RepID=A0A0M8N027_ESCWE|nr:Uncharacterized protein ESCO_002022 [Escovopsis weberi]